MSSSALLMPPSVAPLFDTLWQEAQNLHFDWQVYRQLFGTSQERLTLLARFGVRGFGLFEYVLSHHVTLSIFRLLDPANQGGKDNLSLERLVSEVSAVNPALGTALDGHRQAMRTLMSQHKDLRDKVIAHRDLKTTPTLYDGTSTVKGPSRQTIEQAPAHIREILNGVEVHYSGGPPSTYADEAMVPDDGDGETLIQNLSTLAWIIQPPNWWKFANRRKAPDA